MMSERSAHILKATVREFTRTGEPVSSQLLYDKYDFGIKPAMIRLELKDLVEKGYLEQASYSAGRVPSDRGYEFFAQEALQGELDERVPPRFIELFEERAWPELLTALSADLHLLGVAAENSSDIVYKDGLEYLIDMLDWESKFEIKNVIRDFEDLDERLNRAKERFFTDHMIRFFVGKSPITKSTSLSVMLADYDVDGEQVLLIGIGPKCMDYEKSAKIFKGLKTVTTNYGRGK